MKKKLLAAAAAVCMTVVTAVTASASIGVKLNGNSISFDVLPQLINGRTMVPMRAIFEALGADVEWDEEDQMVYGTKGNTLIALKIGVPAIFVDDEVIELDVSPLIINGRTLVPIRAISEAFGLDVDWDALTQTVIITGDEDDDTDTDTDTNTDTDTDTDTNTDTDTDTNTDTDTDSSASQEEDDTSAEEDLGHQVLDLVNEYRSEAGLGTLEWDDDLAAVALMHSEDMAANNFFSHTNLNNQTPFDRMKSYGITYMAAAENIAMGQRTAESVMNSWMHSPGHYANIMNDSYNKLGVGVAYNSSGTPYWTQCFTD